MVVNDPDIGREVRADFFGERGANVASSSTLSEVAPLAAGTGREDRQPSVLDQQVRTAEGTGATRDFAVGSGWNDTAGYHSSAQPHLSGLAPHRSRARRILGPSLVLGLAIATSGCQSTSSTSTGPSPVKCQVSLEAPSDSIESAGGKGAIAVTAPPECTWTASSGATWITGLTPSSGQGSGRVEFQAAANPAGTTRQGHIAVNDQQIPVQQQPSACRFEVSPRHADYRRRRRNSHYRGHYARGLWLAGQCRGWLGCDDGHQRHGERQRQPSGHS